MNNKDLLEAAEAASDAVGERGAPIEASAAEAPPVKKQAAKKSAPAKKAAARKEAGQAVERQQAPAPAKAVRKLTPTQALESDSALAMIAEALPEVGLTPETVRRTALTLVKQTPKLAACEAASVVQGVVRGAALGLDPDPALGQMWLVPRRTKRVIPGRGAEWLDVAVFQIGYRGLLELIHRTGRVSSVTTQPVYEADEFEATFGRDGGLVHRPQWFGDRGEILGWYSLIELTDGSSAYAVRSVAEVEAHREEHAPRGKDGDVYGPWVDHFEAMAERTAFNAAAKWLPRSVAAPLSGALAVDGTATVTPVGAPVRPEDVIEVDVVTGEITSGEDNDR